MAHVGFERLYRSVHGDLHGYVVRRFGVEGAEDVVAEALMTVYARWADAPSSLDEQRAWAFGVARRKLLEGHRKRSRALQLVPLRPDAVAAVAAVDDGVAAVDRARRLLEVLPEPERDAVYLTVIAGFSSAQAAQILECSVTAITTRTSRARQRLRDVLESEQLEEVDVRASL